MCGTVGKSPHNQVFGEVISNHQIVNLVPIEQVGAQSIVPKTTFGKTAKLHFNGGLLKFCQIMRLGTLMNALGPDTDKIIIDVFNNLPQKVQMS